MELSNARRQPNAITEHRKGHHLFLLSLRVVLLGESEVSQELRVHLQKKRGGKESVYCYQYYSMNHIHAINLTPLRDWAG